MHPTTIELILYVTDQELSKEFYRKVLAMEPVLDVPGMTAFQLSPGLRLGLMPNSGIAKILGNKTPNPADGTGIPRCELYLRVENPLEMMERALEWNAILVSPLLARDWGEEAGYIADPDGHIVAFAKRNG